MAIKFNDKKSEALQASLQGVFTALASDNEEEIKAAVGSYSEVLAEDMKDQASREISKYQTQNRSPLMSRIRTAAYASRSLLVANAPSPV